MHASQDINDLLKELDNLKKSKTKVIVEGKLDKKALNDLGIDNVFVFHKIGRSLSEGIEQFIETLKKKETVVLLTDLDEQGEEYYKIVKDELVQNGFKINNVLRNILKELKISHIEGLSSFVSNNQSVS